jgi:membrane protein DedA with SNARE-associated domain
MTILGAATSTTVLCWAGGLVRERFMKKLPARFIVKKEKRARRLFERYGPAGLGLIGTLLIGPLITILIGSTLLDTRTRVLVWTMAGIILWSAVLTAAGATGIATVSSLLNR